MPAPPSQDELRSWLTRELVRLELAPPAITPDAIEWTQIGHDRGFTGEVFKVAWGESGGESGGGGGGVAIIKVPDPSTSFERCAREVQFLERFGSTLPLALPRLLASRVERADPGPGPGIVWLLLDFIEGEEHDALAGCDATFAALVLDAIAPLHARFWNDPDLDALDWLPHWGQGQVEADRPHRRRADRFRKRAPACVERLGSLLSSSMKRAIDCLHDDFETMLAEMAALPATMIHADLHLDNLVLRPHAGAVEPEVVLLDWQSVSKGPVLYDVVSFLVESLRGAEAHDELIPLYESHLARLRAAGVDPGPVDADPDQLQRMILVVLAGFLSAYGNPDFPTRPQRLQDLFFDLFTQERMGGIVERMTIL